MEKQKPFYYGGQAVIEGVMMRGRENLAIAVRRPDGEIDIKAQPLSELYIGKLRQAPFIRGIIVLIETMALGISALLHSANVALEEEEQEKTTSAMLWGSVIVGMVIAVAVFFVLPLLLTRYLIDPYIESALLSNILEGLIRIIMFILYLWSINFMSDIRRVFEYHGAEHKVVNAYEAGVPLEVEAIKKYSTAHARCGTNFLLVVLLLSIIVFALFGRPDMWLSILSRIILIPVIAALGYEFIRFGGAHMHNPIVHILLIPGLLLQAMTTREPDDNQIEIAVAALKKVVEADNSKQLSFNSF
ncbi:MAG TPA: DUF1385 domain-containing protein [Dehalococcoidia bacterium]|nr:DUF1385 domain-containing protein [Dehalococcoidia bacterium]